METGTSSTLQKGELMIIRTFDAPREEVFRSFTECDRMKCWWGPRDYSAPSCTMDVREGGRYLNSMRSSDGHEYWSTGVFREIHAPDRLVMTDCFADENGNVVPASHYGMEGDWPLEMLLTVTLEEQDGKTRLTLRHSGLDKISDADREDMQQGWSESLDKLEGCLSRH
jgi:uncharacterized protein YndB with AHSA1/START domain